LAQGEAKQALVAFQAANYLEPTGQLLIRIHQVESNLLGRDPPIEPLLDWVKKHPNDGLVQFYAADALVRSGRIPDAIPIYLTLLKRMPNDYRILNNLADALILQGDPRALDYAQQAFQVRPNDAVIMGTLGGALLNQGKVAEALQMLQKAVKLEPENAEIRYQYVQALLKAGDRARAKMELAALLSTGKPFSRLVEARALLAKL
jgi:predicted Zn-dependent protease